ncbi:TetR/AcrR family transcriptional regulator [Amycolatopsis sp. NPDC059027]|uniref:TetR/AcrR family transcriptional regulator n=1 Tax=unclassified Amycolatopsis TaxID=2618356 RepID=UPI00367253A9
MAADDRTGLRERKKRETRLALSHAAIRLCVEHGWPNVSVEDVAAAADVSVRTFRNYFSGKAEAIAAGHLDRALRIADELRARPAEEPLWQALATSVRAQYDVGGDTAEVSERDQRWLDGLRLVLAEPAVRAEVLRADAVAQDELAEAIAERTGTDVAHDVYPRLVAAVAGAGSAVAVGQWLRDDPSGSVVPLLDKVFELITAGLPTP